MSSDVKTQATIGERVKLARAHAPSLIAAKGIQMQQALKLREVALEVEAGKRPMDALKAAQKQAQADVQVELDRDDAAMSAAAASKPPPKITVCRPVGTTVICN